MIPKSERGSITVVAAVAAVITALVVAAVAMTAQFHREHTYAQGVADLAALTGGPHLGDGCARAAAITAAHHLQLSSCTRTHLVITVQVATTVMGIPIHATARAAPVSTSNTTRAPALSNGVLPLPHFGEITHRGQPA